MASFDPDKYLAKKEVEQKANQKEDFNPSDYLAKKPIVIPEPPVETPTGLSESLARGIGTGGTLGWEPSIAGATAAALDSLPSGIAKTLNIPQSGDKSTLIDKYRRYRDMEREANEKAQKDNPKTYLAGNLVGGATAGAILPGAQISSLGDATLVGGLTGLGNSNADLTKADLGQYAKAAKDTGIGAGLGMVTYPIGKYISDKIGNTAESVAASSQRKAGDKALAALGASASDLKDELSKGGSIFTDPEYRSGLGQEALKHLKWTGGVEGFRDRLLKSLAENTENKDALLNQAEQDIQKFGQNPLVGVPSGLQSSTSIPGVSPDLANDLRNNISEGISAMSETPQKASTIQNIQDSANAYINRNVNPAMQNSPLSVEKLRYNLGKYLGDKAFQTPDYDAAAATPIEKGMYGTLKNRLESLVDAANPGAGEQLAGLNDEIGKQVQLAELGIKAHAKNAVSNSHLGDILAYTAGKYAGEGNPIAGLAAIGAKHAGEEYTGWGLKNLLKIYGAKSAEGIANIANKVANSETSMIPTSLAVAGTLSKADNNHLSNVANTLNQNGYARIGNALNNAVQNNDLQQKNALIYSISSNPQTRALVQPNEDEEGNK